MYSRARPGYPQALAGWLDETLGRGLVVAELGAGTGLFTSLLLDLDHRVVAIEPNAEMRGLLTDGFAAQVASGQLRVMDGTAEHTRLAEGGVDLVAAAQAAHWFTPAAARDEFDRVLRPEGQVLLVWNDWRDVPNPFNRDYGAVVRAFLTPGNENLDTRVPDERIPQLLPHRRVERRFVNHVPMTRERLRMLALSASYLPGPQSAAAPTLLEALDAIFARHESGGEVTMEYRTIAYLGR